MNLENKISRTINKTKKSLESLVYAAIITAALAGGARIAKAAIYNVPSDFNTIQAAIDSLNVIDGDDIIVAPETYYENINFNGKNIRIKSIDPNNPDVVASTIIDGGQNGSVVTFNSDEDPNCVLSGFTITNGYAYLDGGGIYCGNISKPTITDCIFSKNSARRYGGGMANWHGSNPRLTNCTFNENLAECDGGGMANWHGSNPRLTNCTFNENSSEYNGGGVYNVFDSNATLTNCTFSENLSSYGRGGGVYNCSSSPKLTNCVLWGNIDNHGIDESSQIDGAYCSPVLNYCCIQGLTGNLGGIGNHGEYPRFADPNSNNYHLKSQAGRYDPNSQKWVIDNETSPCIDAGEPLSPIMYEPFPNGGRINMGAYGGTAEASKSYFGLPLCQTIVAGDINGDCKVDFKDFAIFSDNWLERGP